MHLILFLGKKQQYDHAKKDFMDLLSTVDKKTLEQGWKKTKKEIDQDPRYKGVKVIADREAFYKEFLHEPSDKPLVTQDVLPTALLDKKARQEASLRERQEQVQKEREANERAYKNQKSHLMHGESETVLKTMMIDLVKSHTARWEDHEAVLQNDPRFSQVILSPSECSALFHRHTRDLLDKAVHALHALLDTIVRPDSNWKSVFPTIEQDPRVLRLEKSSSELESLFNAYKKGRMDKMRRDFTDALKECTFMDFHVRQALQSASLEHKGTKELNLDQIWPFINLDEISAILEVRLEFEIHSLERQTVSGNGNSKKRKRQHDSRVHSHTCRSNSSRKRRRARSHFSHACGWSCFLIQYILYYLQLPAHMCLTRASLSSMTLDPIEPNTVIKTCPRPGLNPVIGRMSWSPIIREVSPNSRRRFQSMP